MNNFVKCKGSHKIVNNHCLEGRQREALERGLVELPEFPLKERIMDVKIRCQTSKATKVVSLKSEANLYFMLILKVYIDPHEHETQLVREMFRLIYADFRNKKLEIR